MYPNPQTSVNISINVNVIIFCLSLFPSVSLYLSLSLSVSLCLCLCLTDLWESTGTSVQINALPVLLLRQVSQRVMVYCKLSVFERLEAQIKVSKWTS